MPNQAGADPKPRGVSFIKSKILAPSLTSTYIVNIQPPENFTFLNDRTKSLGIVNNPVNRYDYLSIPCTEASLPGSSIATNEITDDHTGVTDRHAYRRLYDDRISLTFYVDSEKYYAIKFFESWMAAIVNEQSNKGKTNSFDSRNYNYRVTFPKYYYASAFNIIKFEKNYQSPTGELGQSIQYDFIHAFPISLDSMPVSYESSQLLKCSVSFSYSRYWLKNLKTSNPTSQPNPNAPGIEELNSRLPTQENSLTLYNSSGQAQSTVSIDPNRPTLGQLFE
jgi:hypothetical protein